jgi:hypothetical protein
MKNNGLFYAGVWIDYRRIQGMNLSEDGTQPEEPEGEKAQHHQQRGSELRAMMRDVIPQQNQQAAVCDLR